MSEVEELGCVIRKIDGPATLGSLELAEGIIAAGYSKAPGHHSTEWGVRDPWGDHPVSGPTQAFNIVKNMREAGQEATVIWRGVTKWMEQEDPD